MCENAQFSCEDALQEDSDEIIKMGYLSIIYYDTMIVSILNKGLSFETLHKFKKLYCIKSLLQIIQQIVHVFKPY